MSDVRHVRHSCEEERDEPVALPDDPEAVLRALLAVKPDDEPADVGKDSVAESD